MFLTWLFARPSAFKAVNNTVRQTVNAGTIYQVQYPTQVFDLDREYNPATSTFTPKQDGVYSIIASVNFLPDNDQVNYRVRIIIRVNGIDQVVDNDFWGALSIGNVISVSGILQLSAGDKVTIFAESSTNGTFNPQATATHFEAARLPSPLFNEPSFSRMIFSENAPQENSNF